MLNQSKLSFWQINQGRNSSLGASTAFSFAGADTTTPIAGNLPLIFSRGTNATQYRQGDGWLVYGPNNGVQNSENLGGTGWTALAVTPTVTTAVAPPPGCGTVYKISEDNTTAQHTMTYSQTSCPVVAGFYYTVSAFMQAAERTTAALQIPQAASFGGTNPRININLANGTITGQSTSVVFSSITDVGNGWFRISVTGLATANAAGSGVVIAPNQIGSFAGTTGFGIYATGAQFEVGPYMQTYNPTAGGAYFGPRLDYDPTTLASQGLLIEEARTNLIQQSVDFTKVWSGTDITVSVDSTLSPEGIANCNLITEGSSGTSNIAQATQAFTANSVTTFSLFMKRGNHDWMRISYREGTSVDGAQVWVNLATGTIGTIQLVGAGTGFTAEIQQLPNGWYRLKFSGLINATATTAVPFIASATGDTVSTRVNGATHYLYGGQAEVGADATSYIPTSAATVTRAADSASVNITSVYNAAQGTMYVRYKSYRKSPLVSVGGLTLTDGSSSNRMYIRIANSASNAGGAAITATVQQASLSGGAYAQNTDTKDALSYNTNDFAFSDRGAAPATSASGTPPSGLTTMFIGFDPYTSGASTAYINGWVRRVALYNSRLNNTQLQTMTT